MEWIKILPVYYGGTPAGVDATLQWIGETWPYSASLDFVNYGPSTDYSLWIATYDWLKSQSSLDFSKAMQDVLSHYLPGKLYFPMADTSEEVPPLLLLRLPHGGVTGTPLHNPIGSIAGYLVMELAGILSGLNWTDYWYLGMMDDIIVFTSDKAMRKKMIENFTEAARLVGADAQAKKTFLGSAKTSYWSKCLWVVQHHTNEVRAFKAASRWLGMRVLRENLPAGAVGAPYWTLLGLAQTGMYVPPFWYDLWWLLRGYYPGTLKQALRTLSMSDLEEIAIMHSRTAKTWIDSSAEALTVGELDAQLSKIDYRMYQYGSVIEENKISSYRNLSRDTWYPRILTSFNPKVIKQFKLYEEYTTLL
jgi:hypothetical protein